MGRTTVAELVSKAVEDGSATASNGRWTALYRPEISEVTVTHFVTDMIAVDVESRTVTPLDRGWGSQTDKQGINAILNYERLGESYWSLFPE